ncbi:phage integrase SAM-like domain-containing protein [Christiangramia marina]|uniref:phage integrase SAM-like domain-containing protein n=1 Tax=Christiangramia marina TaxID=409436 RepID=UPI003AA8147B
MATLKFFTRSKSETSVINVRFMQGRKFDIHRSTLITVQSKHWNNKAGFFKSNAEFKGRKKLEKRLNDLRTEISDRFNEDYSTGAKINGDWLEGVLSDFFEQSPDLQLEYLCDYAEFHLDNLPNKILKNGSTGVKKATKQKYETNLRKLKEFESYKNKRFLLSEVDMNFHREFIQYLKNEHFLNFNSIGKYLTLVKTICLDANKTKGFKISDSILNGNFKITKEPTTFITLDESEIEKIYNKDFSRSPHLDNARNWLIIGVWSGARVSDLLNFTKNNIKGEYLEYTAIKTGSKIVLPLHYQVIETLEKNNGQFPRKISSQKFNDYIKKVCEKVEIDKPVTAGKRIETKEKDKNKKSIWRKVVKEYPKHELVSTHICRRSFATNHYGKIPTPVIMSATGHKTEKMFLNYIGKAPKDNADVLAQYWNRVQIKQSRKPEFEIIKTAN